MNIASSTKASRLWRPFAAAQVAVLVVALVLPAGAVLAAPSPTGATISSDQADYSPGATVTLTGAGWAAGEPVAIIVDDAIGQTWQYTNTDVASETGSFTDVFQLPVYFISNYNVTATGPTSGTATTTFTDLSIGTYDQCANDQGDGYPNGDTGCRWINGNLNHNNSSYPENTATVQRLWLTDLAPGSTHTVTLDYGTTKAGKHAYDFLTTWNWSEGWITLADRCQDITGCETATEMQLGIPVDPNAGGYDGGQFFAMRGGAMTAVSPITPLGSYTGDSDAQLTITFTTDSSGDMCTTKSGVTTCGVALWFGAHVAWENQWGAGTGAGSIPGSPYHVSLVALDSAAVGSRDNQMQASAVTGYGLLTITKAVTGGPVSYPQTNFTVHVVCTGNGNKVLPGFPQDVTIGYPTTGSATVTQIPLPATCTVTEPTVPAPPIGYTWGTPTITGSPVDLTGDVSSVAVTVTNPLVPDQGYFKISKVFSSSAYTGAFTMNYVCTDAAATSGSVDVLAGATSAAIGPIDTYNGTTPVTCTVTEAVPTNPAGYTFGTPSYDPAGGTVTITKGNAAAAVLVTVTNTITKDQGYFKISKVFSSSAYTGAFTMNYVCTDAAATSGSVDVLAGATSAAIGPIDTYNGTTPVTCTVTEAVPTNPAGYTFGTPSYDPAGGTVTITKGNAAAAVLVTVTNTITKDQGYFKISKVFSSSAYTGAFTMNYVCTDAAATSGSVDVLAGATSAAIGPIDTYNGTTPVTCTVTEAVPTNPAGYTFGTPSYDPAGGTVTITKGNAAAAVLVTVTNTITKDQGYFKISKVFSSSAYTGAFTMNYVCTDAAATSGSVDVLAGATSAAIGPIDTYNGTTPVTCTVTEAVPTNPAGYTFGTPSYDPAGGTVTITKGNAAAAVLVTVTNTITKDQGYFKISKVFSSSAYTGAFTMNYVCTDAAATSGSVDVLAGATSAAIGPIDTYNGTTPVTCTVTEAVPTNPAGYTFGTPSYDPAGGTVTITKGNAAAAVLVTVTNTITKDQGYFKISKVFSSSAYTGAFTMNYVCTDAAATSGSVDVLAGATSAAIGPIDTYNGTTPVTCTVTEAVPTNPAGYTFGTPSYDPAGGTVTITKGNAAAAVLVTVTNTITKLPTIIVKKVTTGVAGGPFGYTTTGGNGLDSSFSLTTSGPDLAGADQESFEIAYAGIGGDYSVTEGVTSGFVLTDVGCVVTVAGDAGTVVGSDLGTRTGSITNLTAGTTVTCTFINSGAQTTRTQGFWATHLSLVQLVWNPSSQTVGGITTDGMTAGERTLCGASPLTVPQVMGGFWSNIAKTTTGAKRSQLDQARMQLLQQLLAAILNNQLFGSVPTGSISIDQAKAAFCTGTLKQVRAAASAMASFNESGDTGLFTPGVSADPKASRAIADLAFWDVLP